MVIQGVLPERPNDEDKNDSKNLDDAEKPANGGEVRICSNCIQRERKRAGRKKTKREEEQQQQSGDVGFIRQSLQLRQRRKTEQRRIYM